MTRIATIPSIAEAPPAAKPLLEDARKKLGSVPNLFRVIANSPAALAGYFDLSAALSKGRLDAKTHERIALAVGASNDPKADAAVRFAATIVRNRGHVSDADVVAVRQAGFDDAELVEIVAHVALNTLTNYVNEVARTEIDFPEVSPRKTA